MRILQLFGLVLLFFASPALARDGGQPAWIVSQTSGQVQVIRAGMQPASGEVRAALTPGDVVATGPTGRAMLTRGSDYVVVAPGSRLLLPKEEQPTGVTRLIQQVGTMLFKVKHTGVPHFRVDTPMLAAVVKGTSFTVIVDGNRNAVQVTEGIVDVSALNGGQHRLVQRGMTVIVSRDRPGEVIEVKPGTVNPPNTGEEEAVKVEGSGDVPLSTVTALTSGLVREAPVTAVLAEANSSVATLLTVTSSVTSPGTSTPIVTVPDSDTPGVSTPSVTTPEITTPEITTPEITTPVVTVPEVTVPVVTVPAVTVPELTIPVVTVPEVTTPAITTPALTTPQS
jgi:hypothetical protein